MQHLNQPRQEGLGLHEAILKSAEARPVLMAAVTTALGLILFLLATGTGSDVQKPIARVVVGGLVISTASTLPSYFSIFQMVLCSIRDRKLTQ